MAIKNYITGEVPFLENYTPFQSPEGLEVVYNLSDMFSYDLLADKIVNIDYELGARSSYVTTLSVKNITTTANLSVALYFNNAIFRITNPDIASSDITGNTSKSITTLLPEKTTSYIIELNKDTLNTTSTLSSIENEIKVEVSNIPSNDIVYRNILSEVLTPITLPELITVE